MMIKNKIENSSIKLSSNNLKDITNLPVPHYQRGVQKNCIVHIGVGGFHRSHQAWFLNELLEKDKADWYICGMGVRDEDEHICNILKSQDYLYTLMVKTPNGKIEPRVIGSIMNFIM